MIFHIELIIAMIYQELRSNRKKMSSFVFSRVNFLVNRSGYFLIFLLLASKSSSDNRPIGRIDSLAIAGPWIKTLWTVGVIGYHQLDIARYSHTLTLSSRLSLLLSSRLLFYSFARKIHIALNVTT